MEGFRSCLLLGETQNNDRKGASPGGFPGAGEAPQPKVPGRLPPRRCCTCSSVVAESLPETRQLRAGQGHRLTLVTTPRVLPGALTDLPDQGPQPSLKGTEAHGFTEQAESSECTPMTGVSPGRRPEPRACPLQTKPPDPLSRQLDRRPGCCRQGGGFSELSMGIYISGEELPN